MIGDTLDRLIGVFSPSRAVKRLAARVQYEQLRERALDAGKLHSGNKGWQAKLQSANALPIGEIQRARYRSWDLYWNNPFARKLISSLESRVVGTGLWPEPQIVRKDGSPHEEARAVAKRLFRAFATHSDYLGAPGRGGQDFIAQQRLVLRATALSGDCLVDKRVLTDAEAQSRGSHRLVAHVIHGERLADTFFRSGAAVEAGNYI
jgi:capsid protein